MPGRTSSWLFLQLYHTLVHIRDINSETVSHYHAAPPASIQTLVNGTICTKLPSREQWIQAYRNDKEMCALTALVLKPDLINNKSLAEINHNYRGAIRNSYICIEDDMLIFKEPIGGSSSYTRLQIVPREFYNVIFVAFHTNPIGGHLNPYRTLHRIRLRFYFPGMYTYIVKMCSTCPGCALSNPTCSKSSELIYGFPVEALFKVMHFDGFSAGTQKGFEGNECFLIGCCGMTAFACVEPVSHATATTFASAIMKILLRFGICFTAVLDKDSKFFGVCREALALLQVNCHILSSTNANPMLVERINRYLNKGLKIMCNERESIRVAQESILLLLYAWNSCPIAGTDISRSLVAVGREFQFPIDFSSDKHLELTSTTNAIQSYSNQLALRLEACHKVAHLLVTEMRSYHREMINAKRPDPRVYAPGILYSPAPLSNQMLNAVSLTNLNLRTRDLGGSLNTLAERHTKLCTHTRPLKTTKRMLQIYAPTLPNSFHSNLLMVVTISLVNFTNQFRLQHSRKPGSKGLNLSNHMYYPPIWRLLDNATPSIGQAYLN